MFNKRIFDFSFSFLGLVILSPLLLIVTLIIKFKMGCPIFYKQERVGRFGKSFTIYKFRTMIPDHEGGTITLKGENRITPLGAILRKYKVDELPELWNVLKGDMSIVGPRPDVSDYIDKLYPDDRIILEFRPGITSPASLKYFNEEELVASASNPKKFYDEIIWPDKVKMNVKYCVNWNFWADINITLQTIFNASHRKWINA